MRTYILAMVMINVLKKMSKRHHDEDDDDEDYMSDKILAAAAQVSAPQLLNPRRRMPPPPAPVATEKPRKLIEVEQREQGLSTAISSDNKGFQLLKKMGYKEGSKLGVSQSGGLTEPIPIKIHPSRSGLGERQEKEEKIRLKEAVKTKFQQQVHSTYQDHLKQKYHSKRLRIDIAKCQSVCERLDREKFQLEESNLWKNNNAEKIEEDEDEEDANDQSSMESQLQTLTEYLRDKHLYCIWCGQRFETAEELEDNCPGNEKDLH